MTVAPAEIPPPRTAVQFALNHLGTVIATGIAAFAATDVLITARFDLNTGLAIITALTPQALAAGALLSLIPFTAGAALIVISVILPERGFGSLRPPSVLFFMVALLAGAVVLVPLAYFITSVALAGAGAYERIRRLPNTRAAALPSERVPLIAVFILVLGVAFSMRPWLPQENLTVTGARAFSGYVLRSDASWVTVLRDRDRHVLLIPVHQLAGRDICQSSSDAFTEKPLANVLVHSTPYRRKCL